jgi:hypothetical protein
MSTLCRREEFPSLAKRGQGRFSEEYVYSFMNSLIMMKGENPVRNSGRCDSKPSGALNSA